MTNLRKINALLTIVLIGVCFIGCAAWKPAAEVEIPEFPAEYTNTSLSGALNDDPWWLVFNDPGLNSMMEEALAENLTIKQAAGRLAQLKAVYRMSRSNLMPALVGSGSYQKSDILGDAPANSGGNSGGSGQSGGGSGLSGVTLEGYTVGLSASYELDLWGKLTKQRSAALHDYLATEEDLKAVVLMISTQVAGAYYRVIELEQQLELLNLTVSGYEDYLEIVQGRYERGVSPSVELYQARINLARGRSQKTQVEAALSSTRNALSILLGKFPSNLETKSGTIPERLPVINTGLPRGLLQRRPDVRAAYHRLQSADARWAEALVARYPSFSLTGTLGSSSDDLSGAVDPDNMLWNAIGSLTMPVFMGGTFKANADRTEAAFNTQVSSYKATLLNSFREVEDALVGLVKQREYLVEIEDLANSADNLLNVATDRYMNGLTDYLPLVLAQTENLNAQRSLISTRRELIDSHIRLSAALGGGWMDVELIKVEMESN